MSDIVERLRDIAHASAQEWPVADVQCVYEAAAEIERLRAAIVPLAGIPIEDFGLQNKPDRPLMGWNGHRIHAADVIAARAALTPAAPAPGP